MWHKENKNIINLISDNKVCCFVVQLFFFSYELSGGSAEEAVRTRFEITCLTSHLHTKAYKHFFVRYFSFFCYFLVYWLNTQHYASALFTSLVNNITSFSRQLLFPTDFSFVCTYLVIIKFNKKYSPIVCVHLSYLHGFMLAKIMSIYSHIYYQLPM